eukprot:TRINITY_DN10878_c0_g1_i1.p3 TRINITY_DN10878_c0_g1~~TRINITY_DN10878_c0_g1_i1.p3  ORF type:complete len:54 (+),score=4.33 TRINITY_DN10878_c0_g1_i1:217-378(+)
MYSEVMNFMVVFDVEMRYKSGRCKRSVQLTGRKVDSHFGIRRCLCKVLMISLK